MTILAEVIPRPLHFTKVESGSFPSTGGLWPPTLGRASAALRSNRKICLLPPRKTRWIWPMTVIQNFCYFLSYPHFDQVIFQCLTSRVVPTFFQHGRQLHQINRGFPPRFFYRNAIARVMSFTMHMQLVNFLCPPHFGHVWAPVLFSPVLLTLGDEKGRQTIYFSPIVIYLIHQGSMSLLLAAIQAYEKKKNFKAHLGFDIVTGTHCNSDWSPESPRLLALCK